MPIETNPIANRQWGCSTKTKPTDIQLAHKANKTKKKKKKKTTKSTQSSEASSKSSAGNSKSASRRRTSKVTRSSRQPGKPSGTRNLPDLQTLKPLVASKVYKACPPSRFKFKDTRKFKLSHEIIAQDRAVRAINVGLGIRKPGYNIYVAGIQGTGKTSVMKAFLERWSGNATTPCDWIYVTNFNETENPRAIELRSGTAREFRRRMESLIKALRERIPAALQSEDYENAVNAYLSASNERKSKLYTDLEKRAKSMDFTIKSTRMGIETIPIFDGRALTEKEYGKLNDGDRTVIEDRRSELEPEVLDFARQVRSIETETSEYVEKLRSNLGLEVIGEAIAPLQKDYEDCPELITYLGEVKEHINDNLLDFVDDDENQPGPELAFAAPEERDPFRKYRVNIFIDNKQTAGAPVIIETNPTYYNLFGRIDKNVEHGMYLTDFTMIKSGAVHRANGGYLVLNAMDIFKTASIWDTLKRILKNRRGFIEDMGEQYSLLPTSGLRPEPIPLDLKVILIGNGEIYHMLYDYDEDFHKIFKIKADFDYKMPRTPKNVTAYASFVATRARVEELLPYDPSGVAAVVEYGSRLVEDQRFLSTRFGEIKDLTIEADFIARELNETLVDRRHVEQALEQKFYRLNLPEEQLLEMIKSEDILLSVSGTKVGQVNGLAVYDMGDYSFGKIGRITCTISTSEEGVLNIERATKLSGKIHDKGVYILSGFLNAVLAKDRRIAYSASVCFEQSYGLIDGDSATVAELVAILSAMSETPVFQSVAMTGSLDQFGQVQPVGGINEKVEGFYKTCELIGKDGPFRVLIPHQNSENLMLQKGIREAVEDGKLEVIPIKSINDAFEAATGVALGFKNVTDETFAKNSALDIIQRRLDALHDEHVEEEKEINEPTAYKAAKSKPASTDKDRQPKGKKRASGSGR